MFDIKKLWNDCVNYAKNNRNVVLVAVAIVAIVIVVVSLHRRPKSSPASGNSPSDTDKDNKDQKHGLATDQGHGLAFPVGTLSDPSSSSDSCYVMVEAPGSSPLVSRVQGMWTPEPPVSPAALRLRCHSSLTSDGFNCI